LVGEGGFEPPTT